jgi:hypothetical protein
MSECNAVVTKPTIQERFERYHNDHPEVYSLFKRFASELKQAGRDRFGSDAIIQRIRWHYAIRPDSIERKFKINDHFSSRYARLLMDEDESFNNFFEIRSLKS